MDSILDVLPRDGALFTGRTGAVPLPDGNVLLITPTSAQVVPSAAEPPHNAVPAPDEDILIRRPSALAGYALLPSPAAAREVEGEGTWNDAFRRIWPQRDEPDTYVRRDPYTGGAIRAAQALRRAAGTGCEAVALSLQIRAPDASDPEAAYQQVKALEGLADAARMFSLPVVAATLELGPAIKLEVSAYTAIGTRFSSADASAPLALHVGWELAVLGRMSADSYTAEEDFPPPIDLVTEGRVLEIARAIGSAMPLARGGFAVALARCCAAGGLGVRVSLPTAWQGLPRTAVLFGEAQSRMLFCLPSWRLRDLLGHAAQLDVPVERLGTVSGVELIVEEVIELEVRELT